MLVWRFLQQDLDILSGQALKSSKLSLKPILRLINRIIMYYSGAAAFTGRNLVFGSYGDIFAI